MTQDKKMYRGGRWPLLYIIPVILAICIIAVPLFQDWASDSSDELSPVGLDVGSLPSITGKVTICGSFGDGEYYALSSDGTLTVSGSEIELPDIHGTVIDDRPWGEINLRTVKKVLFENGVTSIGSFSFSGCVSLSQVIFSDSIDSIGEGAFYGCVSLGSINLPSSVTTIGHQAFSGCNSLTQVTVPSSVSSIGEGAFYLCTSLQSVTLPNTLESIKDLTFSGCSSLKSITIPSSVDSIGFLAFTGCSSLEYVYIPNSVTSIGDSAFRGCTSLSGVSLPSGIDTVPNDMFNGCTSLKSVSLPDTVVTVGNGSFSECTSLTEVEMPSSVQTVGSHAFSGCTSLTEVDLSSNTTYVGDYAFSDCTSLYGMKLSSTLEHIGDYAYCRCASLLSLVIPSSVRSIGSYTFFGCISLTSMSLSRSIESIGERAFSECISLSSVTLPSSVTLIGQYAFYGCTSLKTVYNLSSFTLSPGSESNGYIAHHASEVYGGSSVKEIVDGAVTYTVCKRLHSYVVLNIDSKATDITLPSGFDLGKTKVTVYGIGSYSAVYCDGLKRITVPSNVTIIEDYAFSDCGSLKEVTVEGAAYIGNKAFNGCEVLESVYLEGAVSMGEQVFADCKSLSLISIPSTLVYFKDSFQGFEFYDIDGITKIPSDSSELPGHTYDGLGDGTFYRRPYACTLTFEFSDFSMVCSAEYGSVVELPDMVPVKKSEGDVVYEFMGWDGYTEGMTVTGDLVFVALFGIVDETEDNDRTITYVFSNYSLTCVVEYGSMVVLPDTIPVKKPVDGVEYEFKGWDGYTEGMIVTEDVVFTAVFEPVTIVVPQECTLTFVFSNYSMTRTVEYGSPVELPETVPTKRSADGISYVFKGWDGYTEGMTVTEDKVFTAMFEAVSTEAITVTIVYNDGVTEEVYVSKGGVIDEPRFVQGYYRDPAFTKVWNPATKVYRDITVYAVVKASGSSGGDTMWNLDFSTGTLTISGTGGTADWNAKNTPWYVYRGGITSLVVQEGVTYLGSYACYKYSSLTDIVLADSLKGIGKYGVVTSVAEHVKVGSGLDSLGVRGLYGMDFYEGSQQIAIKDFNLRSKEFFGYDGVLYLDNIFGTFGDTVWCIDYVSETLTVSGNGSAGNWTATSAPWYAYKGYFEKVVVEEGVTEIGDYSFYGYSLLESIILADSVERIGTNSIRGCSSLIDIVFGEGLVTIGSNALTGYTFTVSGKTVKSTVSNLAGHSFSGPGNKTFERYE